jgi:hypothetical protein
MIPAVCIQLGQVMLADKSAAARRGGSFLTRAQIAEVADNVLSIQAYAGLDREELIAALCERTTVVSEGHATLGSDDGHIEWLVPQRKEQVSWRYWDRYYLHLSKSIPEAAVESVDKVTEDILSRIEDPQREGGWDRRGLVMGNVQSGKTANYCGLACKAADAGYKVIIILTGLHNNLRSQTQIRMEEGFLGFMNDAGGGETFKKVGVGHIDASVIAQTATSRAELGDFNAKIAKNFGIQIYPEMTPLLFVVKKSVKVLNDNIIPFLRSFADAREEISGRKYVRNVPALIIDDEADLASVDTKQQFFDEEGKPDPDHDPAKTNAAIRSVIRCFEKSAYVAYTATPFANVLIHDKGHTTKLGDDLFPRSFILNIPAPSNYMGPARVFGLARDEDVGLEEVHALPIIRTVSDHAASEAIDEIEGWVPPKLVRKTNHVPRFEGKKQVPPSLRKAILSFLLSTAIRRIREPHPHFNTMLVHVVRFTKVQNEVSRQVSECLKQIEQRLRLGDGDRTPSILDELRQLYQRDFVPTSDSCGALLESDLYQLPAWSELEPLLAKIASGIKVKTVHGSAGDVLDYETHKEHGMDLIAVGGDKLSRGLTLEGLSVSYFLRASRMYDTLMQMGRWFGYREKYIDVCRLFTTAELTEWFGHTSAASEELRREFDHMVRIGATPKEYGLKVRSHPVMLVTSAVKMRHGEKLNTSYSCDVSETIVFKKDLRWLTANFDAVEALLGSLGEPFEGGVKGGYSWKATPEQVTSFLASYKTHEEVPRASSSLWSSYIKKQLARDELKKWTVRLASSAKAEQTRKIAGKSVGLIRRESVIKDDQYPRFVIKQLVSPSDELVDLSGDEEKEAMKLTIKNWEKDKRLNKRKTEPERPGRREIRETRSPESGLLILYPLDPKDVKLGVECPPVMGVAISFPESSDPSVCVSYVVANLFTRIGGDDESY